MNNKILIFGFMFLFLVSLVNALELGAESVICPNFECDDGWVLNQGTLNSLSISTVGGKAVFESIVFPATGNISQDINVQPGSIYNINLDISTVWFDWHDFWVELGGNKSDVFTDEGVYNFNLTAVDDSPLTLVVNRTRTTTIDAFVVVNSLSVKEYIEPLKLTFRFKNKEFTIGEHNTLSMDFKNNNFVVDVHNKVTLKYLISKFRWLWR